jgi:tetraacyldisaccharide 4'-kinase
VNPRPWLSPFGAVFGWVAAVRAALYRLGLLRQARLDGPVISVGNLAVGGSGKTPVVARIAEILRDEGVPVAILSRGYGGSFRGDALVVSDGTTILADAASAGDEPVMLARALPGVVVAVGRHRDAVGRAVEARFGRRVHVLDDGYQHLRLARDLDILCLDPSDLRDRPLPAGRLRERPSTAARADLVLVAGEGELAAHGVRALRFGRRLVGYRDREGQPADAPVRAYLLAGIARPERFEADVAASGVEVVGGRFFRDHHRFTAAEIESVMAAARGAGADALVTTAKDATRLPSTPGGLPLRILAITAAFDDEDRLRDRLLAVARGSTKAQRRPRHALEEAAVSAVAGVVRHLRRPAALALGRMLGRLLGDLDRRHVAIAADNLRRAFPDWDEARLLRTTRSVYAHFGRVLLDILWIHGRPREEVLALVDTVGREHVEAAMTAGKGAILATAHIGNWELHGIAHGWLFGAIGVVARPLDNPALDERLCDFRRVGGNAVIYKQKSLAQVIRAMREGRGVAILLDQNVQEKDGIFVDFFGRPAATTTVAAALALKTGCALVPCHTELRPDGQYRLVYDPPLVWAPTGDRQADIAQITQQLTRHIESWAREIPEQWLWIHRRWKTQPGTPQRSAISDQPSAVSVVQES